MLSVQEGVLVNRWVSLNGKEFKWLLVLPRSLRKQVLDMLHASKSAGHLGREKMLSKVRERYYWVGMTVDVRAYLKQCVACAQKKALQRNIAPPYSMSSWCTTGKNCNRCLNGPLNRNTQRE